LLEVLSDRIRNEPRAQGIHVPVTTTALLMGIETFVGQSSEDGLSPGSPQHRADGAPLQFQECVALLSTIHSAKGQEWKSVFVLNCVDGCIPSDLASGWPAEFDLVCRWYAPHLERLYEDAKTREVDLIQLAQIASTYPNRERFLTELTLDPPNSTSDEAGAPLLDEDYLILEDPSRQGMGTTVVGAAITKQSIICLF
jgi:hypothetical protein